MLHVSNEDVWKRVRQLFVNKAKVYVRKTSKAESTKILADAEHDFWTVIEDYSWLFEEHDQMWIREDLLREAREQLAEMGMEFDVD